MIGQVAIVDYLKLGDVPSLTVRECSGCGARYFDRRNACAACGELEFRSVELPSEGVVRAFTIVSFAAPGIPVPFVAATIDCDGTLVRANLTNVQPDPAHISLGMKVRLATFPIGTDDDGVEAIGFGFEPSN